MPYARQNYLATKIRQAELLGNAGIWRQRVTAPATVPTNGYIENLIGLPPDANRPEYIDYFFTWAKLRLSQCPMEPNAGRVYYFHSAGSDANPGTIGSPKQTLAAMQTLIDTASDGAGLTLKLINGSQWYSTGSDPILDIPSGSNNVCIMSAANASSVLFQRPIINHFSESFTSGWTLESGTTYQKTDAGTQICALYIDDTDQFSYNPRNPAGTWGPFRPIKRCNSVAQVNTGVVSAESGCFYHDGSTLYLNLVTGADPTGLSVRVLRNNDVTCFQMDADGFRGQEILTLGHGMSMASPANQKSGFQFALTNTKAAALVRCGSYYNSSHCIGMVDSSGGCTYLHQCDAGFPQYNVSGGETIINAFATSGLQEQLTVDCDITYGTMPSIDWYTVSSTYRGQSFFAHTSSGVSRFIANIANNMQPGPFQCGTNAKAAVTNLPQTDTHIGGSREGVGFLQARHVVAEEYYKIPLVGYRSVLNWFQGNGTRSIYFNGQYRVCSDVAGLAFYTGNETQDSNFWNNIVELVMGLNPGTRAAYSITNPPATNAVWGWLAHNFYVLHLWDASGAGGFRFPNYDLESSLNTQSFVNNVVVRSDDCTDPLEVRLGGSTSTDGRDNNAWYGGANITSQDDASPILLTTEIDADYRPRPGDGLYRAAKTLTVPILYDHAFNPRPAEGANIGHW